MIKIGNIEASNILIGEILASKMYVGETLVWNSQNLPNNCVEIEYLESDGNQWIDTGIFINQTDFEIGYEASGMGSWGWIHQNNAGGAWISLENSSANNKCHWWYGNYNSHSEGNYQEDFYTIKYTLQGIDINAFHLSYLGYLSGNVSNVSLKFFSLYDFNAQGVSTGTRFVTKFKSFYIKKGGTLVADFIPVRVGQVGYMYDKVSKQLFANQGTGNFILGPDKVVLPSEYTQLEYIESTGTQWIDTGYTSNNVDSFEIIITTNGTTEYMGSNGNLQVDLSAQSNLGKRTIKVTHSENDGPKTYVNDSLVKTEDYHSYNGFIIALFALGINGYQPIVDHYSLAAVYSSQLIINNTVVRNLIPARRNSDNVLGMYDIVTGNFLTNQGTGDFVAGPDK